MFPIFIPSKGRYKINMTAKYLDSMGIKYRVVVEPQEYDLYLKYLKDEK